MKFILPLLFNSMGSASPSKPTFLQKYLVSEFQRRDRAYDTSHVRNYGKRKKIFIAHPTKR